jgi:hypothetical protein
MFGSKRAEQARINKALADAIDELELRINVANETNDKRLGEIGVTVARIMEATLALKDRADAVAPVSDPTKWSPAVALAEARAVLAKRDADTVSS